MNIVLLLFGFAGLILGGEWLVRGAVSIATKFNVSPMLIGLTLVGFGTSTPELVTSVQAAMVGSPGIAVGNVVGSNIANILLILGVAALVLPIAVSRDAFKRDGTMLALATLLCVIVVVVGSLNQATGVLFLVCLGIYLGLTIYLERRHKSPAGVVYDAEAESIAALPGSALKASALLLATALLILVAISGWRITRREGMLLVLGYVSYIVYQLRMLA